MTTERWRQVEALYHAALEREPSQRAAFLDRACAGDEQLRRELESLLAAHDRAGDFLDAPALEAEAKGIAARQARSRAGQQLGHYRILERIGAGGMGEVYLAEDARLDRKVALKLLPDQFTTDVERLQRFVREAKAASTLNHPNIIVIHEIGHEIGETGETHYIAMEFIEGRTLRQQMKQSGIRPREALAVATQVASALAAAHATGIVHRDIKPENIMLRPDGLVKVLDFGLAKLTESRSQPNDAQATTVTGYSTDKGLVMGTPRYMSPEQARGQKVDARTDIFSLGVVLYEMIAGSAPFEGGTPSDVIVAILTSYPPPLASHWPEAPGELELIVEKALRKDREKRYQVIKDLQIDLTDLKEKLEFEARLSQSEPRGGMTNTAGGTSMSGGVTRAPAARAGEAVTPYVASMIGGIKRRRRGVLLALAALVMVVAGLLVFGWRQWTIQRGQPSSPPLIKRLTTTGQAVCAAVSPDGKYVAYAKDEAGQQSLRLIQVATNDDREIASPAKVFYRGITFLPDSNFIYYVRMESESVLYRATLFGGAEKELLHQVDSPIAFSPDGEQFAFVRRNSSTGECMLMLANKDGAGERPLALRKHFESFRLHGPSWSPNGELIACAVDNYPGGYHQVAVVRVADGTEKLLTSQRWENLGQVAWLGDRGGLLAVAIGPNESSTQLWHLAYPSGKARRITNDLNNYVGLSLAADSGALVTLRGDPLINIWVAPGKGASQARQITFGARNKDGWRGLAWTPDGKIVYRSEAGGNPHIRMTAADGTGNKQLSPDTHQNLDPTVSPDGRFIAWTSAPTGVRNIWRMDLNGSNLQQLTDGSGEWYPQYTPNGKWLVYQGLDPGPRRRLLWKKPLDGGAPELLTNHTSYAPVVSPNGKLVAFNYQSEADAPFKMAVIPFEGGDIKPFDLIGPEDRSLRWTPDGSGLAYILTRDGVSNIWSQPAAGGRAKQMTHFDTDRIVNFAWSRDGRLALSRGTDNIDVVMISNFR